MSRLNKISIFGLLLLLLPLQLWAVEPLRIDNELKNEPSRDLTSVPFISKGEVAVGLTASYGSLSSSNASLLYLLSGVEASLSYGSLAPFIAYLYTDNRCIGLRLGYSTLSGLVDSGSIDFGASNDMVIDVPYVDMQSASYNYAIFHRSYLSLDSKGTFGLFAEFEFELSDGKSTMSIDTGGEQISQIRNNNFGLNLSFSPGIVVFVMDNVSTNVSLGMGGLAYSKVTQFDADGNQSGSRVTSQMQFKFNIIDISFGVTIHL